MAGQAASPLPEAGRRLLQLRKGQLSNRASPGHMQQGLPGTYSSIRCRSCRGAEPRPSAPHPIPSPPGLPGGACWTAAAAAAVLGTSLRLSTLLGYYLMDLLSAAGPTDPYMLPLLRRRWALPAPRSCSRSMSPKSGCWPPCLLNVTRYSPRGASQQTRSWMLSW